MDRIHRLGQHRPVQVVKLVIEDSIESRIVQLQEKKSAMINATLSADDQAMGRLTPQDVSGYFLCGDSEDLSLIFDWDRQLSFLFRVRTSYFPTITLLILTDNCV